MCSLEEKACLKLHTKSCFLLFACIMLLKKKKSLNTSVFLVNMKRKLRFQVVLGWPSFWCPVVTTTDFCQKSVYSRQANARKVTQPSLFIQKLARELTTTDQIRLNQTYYFYAS